MKERIFISYKRDNKDVVFKIKDDIEKHVGEKCWIDLDGIESDAQFVNVIIKAIDEADVFLFMYSKKHAEITDFENDWTIREINYAQTKKKRIIFLNIDNTSLSDWFVMMFGLKQQVDVCSDVAMKKLYIDLRKWLSIESDVKKEYNQESRNVAIYKIRVNRPSMLYIDDEEIQLLEANKIAKISLLEGEYWRKVVAVDDANIYDEKELILYGSSKLDNIILDCDDLDKDIKSNVDVVRDEFEKTQKEESTDLVFNVKGVQFTMKRVEGGTFTMGATSKQGGDCEDIEKPAHSVTLDTYYIGVTEVTQALWQAVMGNNPSQFKGNNLPVESVSWDDCQEFIQKLNQLIGKTFSLPTEAQWEFAARGGNQSRGYKYAGSNTLSNVAWCWNNFNSQTHQVAQLQPNELGLYDMSGNVREWCNDWYGRYSSLPQRNPVGPSVGYRRVTRGGSWYDNQYRRYFGVSSRDYGSPSFCCCYFGFRLALVLSH